MTDEDKGGEGWSDYSITYLICSSLHFPQYPLFLSYPFLSFPPFMHAVESSPHEMHNLGIATIRKEKGRHVSYRTSTPIHVHKP
jgi:hypothetical protein